MRIVYYEEFETRGISLKEAIDKDCSLSNTINLLRKKSMFSTFAKRLCLGYLLSFYLFKKLLVQGYKALDMSDSSVPCSLKERFCLVVFRDRGREIDWLSLLCAPTWDWTHSPGMCPDQELDWWPIALLDNASPTQPCWPGHLLSFSPLKVEKCMWASCLTTFPVTWL